jgi:hypothetical protein
VKKNKVFLKLEFSKAHVHFTWLNEDQAYFVISEVEVDFRSILSQAHCGYIDQIFKTELYLLVLDLTEISTTQS